MTELPLKCAKSLRNDTPNQQDLLKLTVKKSMFAVIDHNGDLLRFPFTCGHYP